MSIIYDIYKARRDYRDVHNDFPKSVAISYITGVKLLKQWCEQFNNDNDRKKVRELLMKDDRHEIKIYLNKMTVYGMNLKVTDLVIED